MDRIILLHYGGPVSEQFELVGMRLHVLTFGKPPSFNELITRVRGVMNIECELLHGTYNMGGNRLIYAMLPLGSEDEWHLYKSYASESRLEGSQVVAEIAPLPSGEITVNETGVMTEETVANPIAVEQPTQEEWQGVTHRVSLGSELAKTNSEALNLAVFTDEFNIDKFDENVDTEQHVEEDDETAISESDEENVQPLVETPPDAPVGTVDEGNEEYMPSSTAIPCDDPTSSHIDWNSYYTDEELRALKLKLINLHYYPNHKDLSHIQSAISDSAIVNDEGNPRVQKEAIKMG
jgi:hypothetical protein